MEGLIEAPIEVNTGVRLPGIRRLVTSSTIIEQIVERIVRRDKADRFPSGASI